MITITKVGSLVKIDGIEGHDNVYESISNFQGARMSTDGTQLSLQIGEVNIGFKDLSNFTIGGTVPTNAATVKTALEAVFPSAAPATALPTETVATYAAMTAFISSDPTTKRDFFVTADETNGYQLTKYSYNGVSPVKIDDGKYNISNRSTFGVYEPLFLSASGLASKTNTFNVATGGGLVAAVNGTNASGVLNLPTTIDFTKPFRFAAYVEYGGGANEAKIAIQSSANGRSSVTFHIYNNAITVDIGFANAFNQVYYNQLQVGQRLYFSIVGDGATVTISILSEQRKGIKNTSVLQDTTIADYYRIFPTTYTEGANTTFSGWNQIVITNGSTTNKILGVWCSQNQGYYAGSDSRLKAPAILQTTISADASPVIRLPKNYDGKGKTDLVIWLHANGSDENDSMRTSDVDAGAAAAYLVDSGFIVASIRGTTDTNGGTTYTNGESSNWGAYGGLKFRYDLIQWCLTNLPGIRNIYCVGLSMGCLNALSLQKFYPGLVRAIVGISGVTNLTDSYSNRGFSTVINTAYGTASAGAISDQDPNLRPTLFKGVPVKLWHGDADTTIPKAQNADLFKTNVEAIGGSVTVVNVAGAGHKNAAGLFDGASIVSFLRSNP